MHTELIENTMYLSYVEKLLEQGTIDEIKVPEAMKKFSKDKIRSMGGKVKSALESKDLEKIKKLGKTMPKMLPTQVRALGKKLDSDFDRLERAAKTSLKRISKGKLSGKALDGMSLAMAIASAGGGKNSKKIMAKTIMKVESTYEDEEEGGITSKDVIIFIVSAIGGVAVTLILYQMGIWFVFGPLIFYGLISMILYAIFGGK